MALSVKTAKARYRGDPGFFDIVGDVVRGVGSVLPGPIGLGAKALGGILPGRGRTKVTGTSISSARPVSATMTRMTPQGTRGPAPIVGPGPSGGKVSVWDRLKYTGQTLVPGGQEPFAGTGTALQCNGDGVPTQLMTIERPIAVPASMPRPRGYRLNKSSYITKDGVWHEKGQWWVKARRTNPLNPKALAKATTRVERFNKAKKRTSHISVRAKKCGSCS